MFDHEDSLGKLDEPGSLSNKLRLLHNYLRGQYAFIERIAVALYDADTDLLKTFLYSSEEPSPLVQYEARLADAAALRDVLAMGRPRVVNDMDLFRDGTQRHTQVLAQSGFRASYTLPMRFEGVFFGFIFFNSREANVFSERVLTDLDMIGHMIALLVYNERANIRTLSATVKSALGMTHSRDPETGGHLGRMARYARLIARELAGEHGFSDEYVEHIFEFSPLHDLGKIAIPDSILLKRGRLSEEEVAVMRTHAAKGKTLIDDLLRNYGLDGIGYVDMLRNIALHHHESIDGSGYPVGLRAEAIPIEARIVAVADVFDALTSERPYKPAWTNDQAFAALESMAGFKLDAECVVALIRNRAEVERIQMQFSEDRFG
jgi:HD-GYP domain-containing protein (c-di-GMP phosphodiesterase class II)